MFVEIMTPMSWDKKKTNKKKKKRPCICLACQVTGSDRKREENF